MTVNEHGGGVEIVWCQGQARLRCGGDLMDLDNCVTIVVFGMRKKELCRNGDGDCMHKDRTHTVINGVL
jgi:hypothetical protein